MSRYPGRKGSARAEQLQPMLAHGFTVQRFPLSFSDHNPHINVTSPQLLHWYAPSLGPSGALLMYTLANLPMNVTFELADLGACIGAGVTDPNVDMKVMRVLARAESFVPFRLDWGVIELPTHVGLPTRGQRKTWTHVSVTLHEQWSWLNQSTKEEHTT